jgi:hypothetical protein
VEALVDFTKPGDIDMSVDLGRSDIGMTQEKLDAAQVGPSGQEMCGVRVTYGMGGYLALDTSLPGVFADHFP